MALYSILFKNQYQYTKMARKGEKKAKIKGKVKAFIKSKLEQYTIARRTESIGTWVSAQKLAQNINNPRREQLYGVYETALLNPHLISVINKRITALTNANIKLMVDGEEHEELSAHFKEPWFAHLICEIFNAKLWGHSLIEFVFSEGRITQSILVNRYHVSPEQGVVYLKKGDEKSKINFRKPPITNISIEVGDPQDLGLLNKAAPFALYLKDGYADWASYNEMFGKPYRIGRYDSQVPQNRTEMEKAFKEHGDAPWMVVPDGGGVELLQNNGTGSAHTYEHFIKNCNAELSKLIVGQTMTTVDGSSKSQAMVHKEVEEAINAADMLFIESVLNNQFKQLLELNGYNIGDGQFQFDRTEQLNIEQRLKLDLKLNNIIKIAPEYFYQKYNLPIPEGGAALKNNQESEKGDKPLKGSEKKESLLQMSEDFNQQMALLYGGCCNDVELKDGDSLLGDLSAMLNQLAKSVYDGKKLKGGVFQPLVTKVAQKLWEAVTAGWSEGKSEYDWQKPDTDNLKALQANVNHFSAAKNKAMLAVINSGLMGDDGKPRSFSDFKSFVESVNDTFNVNWLRTEYNYAIASARMAANWKRISEQASDFPYLSYETVGDERVRGSHAALDGLTFKVNDPFWDRNYPPNGWGCRCDVLQLTTEQGKIAIKNNGKIKAETDDLFNENLAKQNKVFSSNHPYHKLNSDGK